MRKMVKERGRVRSFHVVVGDENLLALSLAIAEPDVSGLTDAERAVTSDAARGLSNLEIAKRRRRSLRTVANQLSSAFRKLGVSSRADLAARFARDHARK